VTNTTGAALPFSNGRSCGVALSSPEAFGFGGGPLGDLMRHLARFFTGQGPLNWEIARQMATWAATGGQPEPNPDPLARVRLEELLRVAEMHVSEATGLAPSATGSLTVEAVAPSAWALRTLDAWKPLLEKLAAAMAAPEAAGAAAEEEAGPGEDPMSRLFANLPQVLGPFLLGLQAGSMVGQLATRAMGQFDLPMPRPPSAAVLLVPSNIDGLARDWGLAVDDVRMWICLREAANLAVLGQSHVRSRLEELIGEYVGAFSPTTTAIEERLAGMDLSDMGSLQAAFGDPASLVEELQNDEQRRLQVPLRTLLSAVVGYVDWVMDTIGRRLVGSYQPITEALRRHRLEESAGARMLGQLLGVSLSASDYERGQAFVRGVLERAGPEGLAPLWKSERELPTPAELAAPGLWLARLEIDGDQADS
jgi:putative hydrolase